MSNPFSILRLLLHPRRPSRTPDMTAVADTFWLRRGYEAMTFFGHIVTHSQHDADAMNSRYTSLKNHEMIHLRQAQALHDSWALFYLRYLWYWLRALPLNRRLPGAAYRLNPFEIEAYDHMYDLHYLDHAAAHGTHEWRQHARKKPRQRLREYLARHA